MKVDKKVLNIAAGIIFLLRAVSGLRTLLLQVATGTIYGVNPVVSLMSLFGAIVLSVMGIKALCQKKRGKVLNALGGVYIGYVAYNLVRILPYHFNISSLLSLVLLVGAYILSQRTFDDTFFSTKDTKSEAAKVQIQAEKQNTIYDEQLRDGILTQEEYDQIMKSKN